MLNSFTFLATPFFAGLLLSLTLLRVLFARLATLRPVVALRPASLLRPVVALRPASLLRARAD